MSTKTAAQLKEELAALRAQYITVARDGFAQQTKALFDKWPALKSISWPQYTPYFNDGEECTFSARTDDPDLNGFDEYGDKARGMELDGDNLWLKSKRTIGYSPERDNPDYDPEAKRCVAEVKALLKEFDDDVYEELFDNHVRVTITREGITTEEYEHE